MEENEEEIIQIRKKIASRNPHAFKEKVKVTNPLDDEMPPLIGSDGSEVAEKVHIKGCTCKRSQCSNNYCECHQHGAK